MKSIILKKVQSVGVELGIAQDFEKANSKAINSGSDAGGDVSDWLGKKSKLISGLKSSLKDQENVISLGSKYESQAKELGVDLPSDVKKGVSEAKQWASEIKSIIGALNKISV